jgi:hypothetical protein
MAVNDPIAYGEKAPGDVEHRQHSDEKSSDSDGIPEITWTEKEEKEVRNKVSQAITCSISSAWGLF